MPARTVGITDTLIKLATDFVDGKGGDFLVVFKHVLSLLLKEAGIQEPKSKSK